MKQHQGFQGTRYGESIKLQRYQRFIRDEGAGSRCDERWVMGHIHMTYEVFEWNQSINQSINPGVIRHIKHNTYNTYNTYIQPWSIRMMQASVYSESESWISDSLIIRYQSVHTTYNIQHEHFLRYTWRHWLKPVTGYLSNDWPTTVF